MKGWLYDANGHDQEVEVSKRTVARLGKNHLLWIELQTADDDVLREAAEVLDLDPASIEALMDPEVAPRIDNYGDYYQISLLTVPGHLDEEEDGKRIDMLVGKTWVLTVHKGPVDYFERFREQDKAETLIGRLSAPSLAATLLDWHLASFFKVTASVEAAVDKLDELVLTQDSNAGLLTRMVTLRRQVSGVRSRLAAQRPAFYGLSRPDFALVATDETAAQYQALANRFERALDEVERARDLVVGSFELMDSRTSLQTNRLVKLLTVITVIIGFCGAVAGVFGMNFDAEWTKLGNTGFYVTVGGLLLFSLVALVGAKWAKWF